MTYALLVRKLERRESKFISREELETHCKELELDYYHTISYLISNRYLLRILRGIFYVKSIEERKLKTVNINHLEAIKEALSRKGVKNWYFGLDTALMLNNLTHEYIPTTFVISDTISRPKPFDILGHKVKFIKISERLFGFGILDKGVPYSDPEKTVLDMIYLARYNNLTYPEIEDRTADTIKHCSKNKLGGYMKNYPKSMRKIVEDSV